MTGRRLIILNLLVLCLVFDVFAESTRGRLPDGRAYRIDAAGNELVDYIAELEVNNDALKQRVINLEDELNEKNSAIERLKTTGSLDPEIQERSLISSKTQQVTQQADQDQLAATKDIEAQLISVKELNQRLSLHNQQLFEELNVLAENNKKLMTEKAQVVDFKLDAEVSAKQTKAAQQELEQLKKELALVKKENSVLGSKLIKLTTVSQQSSQPKASLKSQPSVGNSSLNKEINQIELMIQQRDSLFNAYKNTNSKIAFTPQQAISKRGMSLKAIKYRIKSPVSVGEISRLTKDLSDIRLKIKDDLALIKRLSSLKS
ncbi:MAG: hypothetical protein R3A13_08830 [Bdellovibrionota bacterium]